MNERKDGRMAGVRISRREGKNERKKKPKKGGKEGECERRMEAVRKR